MTHTPRKRSESGFYHVVAKGDGGQVIFEGENDRRRYMAILKCCVEEHDVKLHAYCLMGNHVHLLVQDVGPTGEEGIALSSFMKALNEQYAMYYRQVTGRVGRVFQRPFWSEPIDTDEYFLAALRYIHANPEPARICSAADYPWSSYRSYIDGDSFVETDFALELLGGSRQFETLCASGGNWALPFPKSKLRKHLNPDEVAQVALNVLGRDTLNSLRGMQAEELSLHIGKLTKAGLTESEIARVAGLGKSTVHRAL